MTHTDEPRRPDLFDQAELGFDPDELRAKYRAERDRRLRPDGAVQYIAPTGDFGYYVDDPYADPGVTREPLTDEVDALVIGGGFGGLVAGARLRQAGIESIRMIEKASDFGGTWYWNRYPGVRCDIESYIYLPLLEEVGSLPSEKYTRGGEIRDHAQAIAKTFDLYRDVCFQTEVTDLDWDESACRWTVTTDRGDRMTAKYVIISAGPFSRPKLPGIPGIDTFGGHTFHTSRWDYSYTGGDETGGMDKLADKRVAVIGTGATAIQCVPRLAEDAGHLYVFQRTPSSVDERGNRPTDPEWAATLTPGWHQRRRDNFLTVVDGDWPGEDMVGDRWGDLPQCSAAALAAVGELSARERELVLEIADFQKMNEIRDRVDAIVTDKATAQALKPWYRYDCKRPTFSDEYLPAFNRPNVTLVDTGGRGVERITERGIVSGGVEYAVDCVIFATGFEVGRTHPAMSGSPSVHGRDGITFAEHWRNGMRTFQGLTARGFPNLFCMGISQNAVAVNFVHILDEQAVHVAAMIEQAEQRQARYVEPTAQAEDAWLALVRQTSKPNPVLAECTPGYKNNEGMHMDRPDMYGGTALEFHELIRTWRDSNGFVEVLTGGAE
jgi:cation diffusion facilitator CzcD-associated flavoprotein CzcO